MDKFTKREPKSGRRKAKDNNDVGDDFDFLKSDGDSKREAGDGLSSSRGSAPPVSRKTGGWGSEQAADQEVVDSRLLGASDTAADDDDDDDIPMIPTLDDMQEEAFSSTIAAAPTASVKIASMNELESALQKQASLYMLDNEIDLKLLAKALSPESEVIEDDRKWDWDILFTEQMKCNGNE